MPLERSLYVPYRSLGLVCDGPSAPVLHQQGVASFLTTSISAGRALHLYDTQLQLKLVSKSFPSDWPESPITFLAAAHDLTFCALDASICVLKRLKPIALWSLHVENISHLLVVGDVLVSVCKERIGVWRIPSSTKRNVNIEGGLLADIALPQGFVVTALTHPQTYINKVLLGAGDGTCILMNLRTKKIVHRFDGFGSRVNCLVSSPVLDVVGVGLEDGRIVMHNFRADESILTFRHSQNNDGGKGHAVTAISFRTDGDESMVSVDAEGNFYAWDLNKRMVRSEVRHVHAAGAILAAFLPGEPVLVTAGSDNMIKVHVFDSSGGEARVLRAREGHRLPPTIVRFCGYDGSMMVSAGLDKELRLVSAVREARNRSFSQSTLDKGGTRSKKRRRIEAGVEKGAQMPDLFARLPPIVAIASNNIRQRDEDFANIVTVHENLDEVYTWRVQNGATHGHVLIPPEGPEKYELAFRRGDKSTAGKKKKSKKLILKPELRYAICVVLSPCGNYSIVGSQDGRIHSYNLQSGIHQGVYEDAELPFNVDIKEKEESKEVKPVWKKAHGSAIVGLAVDACGDNLISAGRTDNLVKFWNLYARDPVGDPITAPAKIVKVEWCKASDLLVMACADFNIYVYDGATRRLARKFSSHVAPIVDFCFDPNGRRILSASLDGTIRTWDLPSGCLIDTLVCMDAPTSVAVAPSGEYVASTHINSLGISLWVDTSKFRSLLMVRQGRQEDDAVTTVDPAETDEEEGNAKGSFEEGFDKAIAAGESENVKHGNALSASPTPLSGEVATLSMKPVTHWTTLSNLQAIKERNKPLEPPKKPESAPFFLPTVKGLKFEFDTEEADGSKIKKSKKSKKKKKPCEEDEDAWTNSNFGRLVAKEQYGSAAELLRKLDASGVDLEIQTLDGAISRRNAARFFSEQLKSAHEFELKQAFLGVFLKVHGMDLAKDEGGCQLLEELLSAHHEAWNKLRDTFATVTCLSSYFATDV